MTINKFSFQVFVLFSIFVLGGLAFLADAWVHTTTTSVHGIIQRSTNGDSSSQLSQVALLTNDIENNNDEDDRRLVERQLGYLPPNYVRVSAKTATTTAAGSAPVAIQTYPLHGGARKRQNKARRNGTNKVGTPFPTLFWLTNPALHHAVSILEYEGYVKLFKERLDVGDRFCRDQFQRCNLAYGSLRWSTLSASDRETLVSHPEMGRQRRMLQESGVSGTEMWIPDNHNIKCLHAHYAYYRSMFSGKDDEYYDPVGSWIHDKLLEESNIDRSLLLLE